MFLNGHMYLLFSKKEHVSTILLTVGFLFEQGHVRIIGGAECLIVLCIWWRCVLELLVSRNRFLTGMMNYSSAISNSSLCKILANICAFVVMPSATVAKEIQVPVGRLPISESCGLLKRQWDHEFHEV